MSSVSAPLDGTWRSLGQSLAAALRYRPVVQATVAVIGGIVWADWAVPPHPLLGGLGVAAAALALIAFHRFRPVSRPFGLALLFLVGAALHTAHLRPTATDIIHLSGQKLPRVEALVTAARRPESAPPQLVARLEYGNHQGLALLTLPPLADGIAYPRVGDSLQLGEVRLEPMAAARARPSRDLAQLRRESIFTRGEVRAVLGRSRGGAPGNRLRDYGARWGRRMLDGLRAAMPGRDAQGYADLLASMVYGQRAVPVRADHVATFRASGTIHLLVVSGAQVSLLAATFMLLMRGRRRVMPLWAVIITALGLGCFAVVVGLGVSVTRAIAMQVLVLGSFAWGRSYDLPTALALSALGLCLVDPAALFEIGPQLTYACTLGLYLFLPTARPGEHRPCLQDLAQAAVRGSLGAWIMATPILVAHGKPVVLLGALANIVAVPLAAVILHLGLLAIAVGLVWAPLAVPACYLARGALWVLLETTHFFAALPGAVLPGVHLSGWAIAGWYGAAGALARGLQGLRPAAQPASRQVGWALALAAVLAGGLTPHLAWRTRPPPRLEMHLLDVGAGQCLLLRSPSGANVLVDAGAEWSHDPAGLAGQHLLPYLARQGVRRLQAMLLTHAHRDHCSLAPLVLAQIPVDQLLLGPDEEADTAWREALDVARKRQIPTAPVAAGGRLELGHGVRLHVLEPTRLLARTDQDANNNSVVLRLEYGRFSALLPADLQAEGEARLTADYADQPQKLRAEVLVGAHHGSRFSGTTTLLDAVQPRLVLLSTGRGRLAPTRAGLAGYGARELTIWRTDQSGTLVLRTDGADTEVRGER